MAQPIERFELPRKDWYDEEGRIYKDVLIENFNAIEEKLISISQLDVFITDLPDFADMSYPDVTLDDDDNKVVNLKSFLEITGIVNYPIELVFDGKTCKKISWWGDDYKYHTVEDDPTAASTSSPYIYFKPNPTDGNYVYATSSSTTPSDAYFIGFYDGSRVVTANTAIPLDLNLLEGLSQMETTAKTAATSTMDTSDNGGQIPWATSNIPNAIGWHKYQEHNKSSQTVYMTEFGQK